MEKQVIAVWCLSNVASLNVWEMKDDEAMLVGINNEAPEWCEIIHIEEQGQEASENDELIAGIMFRDSFWRLNDCMRVR